jgi:hypothetical protein
MEQTAIDPTLESFVGSLEDAIEMATAIELELREIFVNKQKRINRKIDQLRLANSDKSSSAC